MTVTDSGAGQVGQAIDPSIIVVFGADGDLTRRKLIPALCNLSVSQHLPNQFAVVGFAITPMSSQEFRDKLSREIREFAGDQLDLPFREWLAPRLHYLTGDFRDATAYRRLHELIEEVDKTHGTRGNVLFYLATAPTFFSEIVQQLGIRGLTVERERSWRRVIIEKPFGSDVESACALSRELSRVLKESQIYRIDHYLGKETVQNILVFRFANGIFEPLWNRRYIDHVQITVAESIGVEHRGRYYDAAGALRDMVSNHLLTLVSLIAMEPPHSFDADAVRDEKSKVLRAIVPFTPLEVLRSIAAGQYGEGVVGGKPVPGYRAEPHVAQDSDTETFVAMKLLIDNWRWAGVPFYLRTGKRLPKRVTEIAIQFRGAPHMLFQKTPTEQLAPNLLVIRIQPDEGISLRFDAKIPGPMVRVGAVDMDFQYAKYFGDAPSTGYETLLHDCLVGDGTLFQRADNVEVAWNVVQPILDVWKKLPRHGVPIYPAGTWGPPEANDLLRREGRRWRNPD